MSELDHWHPVLLSRELRAKPVGVTVCGRKLVVWRTRDGVAALDDACPHRGMPLHRGHLEDDRVVCPYHGWRFGADGACLAIPSLTAEQALDISRITVRRLPAAESQGMIFLWASGESGAAPDEPPPDFPGVVGGAPKLVDCMDFDTHIDHAVVGLMDPAHGPFVHRQWWWRTAGSLHEKSKRFEPRPAGFAMVRHPPSRNSRAYALLGGRPSTEITFRLPGLRWEHVQVGARQILALTCLTPLSESRTRITQLVWSDHPIFALAGPLIRAGARRFLRQDGDMVTLQNRGLEADAAFLWIDDADRQAKWYQALKNEWAAARREGRPFHNPVEAATLRWVS